jgi:hypothetical protein
MCESDFALPASVDVTNERDVNPLFVYNFMTWGLCKGKIILLRITL